MTANTWWAIVAVIIGLAFTISLTSLPERFQQWRQRVWESDSDGELPPK